MADVGDWQELSARLDELLALDATEQLHFLAVLEQSNPALSQRLRQLLASRPAMESAGFLSDTSALEASQAQTESALIGAAIGPWTVEAEIGRGGMGSVWRARRSDGRFEGLAAIKFLHFAALGSEGEQRFRREGYLLGQLNHPHIARLLDAGVHAPSHQPYLVMEYVDGIPIDEWCDAHRLPIRERIGLFLRVLDAVAHAHRHLIIHRDIKPANILVTSTGSVKLLDFGIAKLAHQTDPAEQTRSSVAAMTPLYAAPEQILGEAVTTRTDIYALGLVLFRLLTGQHAFQADSREQRWRNATTLEPPLMSRVVGSSSTDVAALRGDLDTIVAKALRQDPELRFGSAESLGDDLIRHLRHAPIAARPATITYRMQKFVRRNRGLVAVTSSAVLILAAAALFATLQMFDAQRQRDVAQHEARRAEASSDFLQLVLSENRTVEQPLTVDDLLNRSVRMLNQQYADDPGFRSRMLLTLATERASRREYDKAEQLMHAARLAARDASDIELEAYVECAQSFLQSGNRRRTDALAALQSAQMKLGRLSELRWETEVQCLRAEANIEGMSTDESGAASARTLALLTQARERMESSSVTHRRDYTAVLSHLAVVHRGRGDIARAFELVQLGGKIHEQNGRGQTRSRMIALNNEAVLLAQMGEFQSAFERLQALEARVARLEPSSRNMVNFSTNYIVAAARMGGAVRTAAWQRLPEVIEALRARGDTLQEIDALTAQLAALLDSEASPTAIDTTVARVNTLLDAPGRDIPPEYHTALLGSWVRLDLQRGDASAARARIDHWVHELTRQDDQRLLAEVMLEASALSLQLAEFKRAIEESTHAVSLLERLARGTDKSGRVGDALVILAKAHIGAKQESLATRPLERAVRCLVNGYGQNHERTTAARRLLLSISNS